MTKSNGDYTYTPYTSFSRNLEYHLNLIHKIKKGKIKVNEKMMKNIDLEFKQAVIEAICLAKTRPRILYPWHRRWWVYMWNHFKEDGEVGE